MWFYAVYFNEFTLFIPGLLWTTIRTRTLQKVVDILRTVPIATAVIVHLYGATPWSTVVWLAVVGWTVFFNLIMYICDVAKDPPFDAFVYTVAHISVLQWLASTTTSSKILRITAAAVNLAALAVFLYALFVAVPLSRAWKCYPSRDPRTFVYGYCPQYSGNYKTNRACAIRVGEQIATPRCDPHNYPEEDSLTEALSWSGHVAGHLLLVTVVLHLAQLEGSASRARVQSCIATARKHLNS